VYIGAVEGSGVWDEAGALSEEVLVALLARHAALASTAGGSDRH
jgi:hypothetical protein